MKKYLIVTLNMIFWLWQPHALAGTMQAELDRVANELIVSYEVVSNVNDAATCEKDVGAPQCLLGEISLTFPISLPDNNWRIYFSSRKTIAWEGSDDFDIKHINGDVHTIAFLGKHIVPGKAYVIPFKAKGDYISELQMLPNYFIALPSQPSSAKLIKSTLPKIDPESDLMYLPYVKPFVTANQQKRAATDISPLATPEFLCQYYEKINTFSKQDSNDSYHIIPQMKQSIFKRKKVSLKSGLYIPSEHQENSELSAAFLTLQKNGIQINKNLERGAVQLSLVVDKESDIKEQGYDLTIASNKINVTAKSNTGLFYGLISLSQLLDKNLDLPIGKITDSPRYEFRGVLLDVARNFHSKAFILNLLDNMAMLKLNKFHLHLADDEGWRLEIPGLPELTEVGAHRCFDPSEQQCLSPQLGSGPFKETEVNGYFSTEDYIEILKYADARHIEVIPALDMPGHSRAAIKAMDARYRKYMAENLPQKAKEYALTEINDKSIYQSIQHYNDNTLNPCIDSTYHFVDKILTEIISIHERAGVPLKRYHIGADETAGAWRDSPACKQLIQIDKNIKKVENLTAYFVERIAQKVSAKGIIPGAWGDGVEHANKDNLPKNMQVNIWGLLPDQSHNSAHHFANLGFDTVLSLPDVLYLDSPYQADSKEQGNDWATRSIDTFKSFQFMPDNLPAHAEIWPDLLGHNYSTTEEIAIDKERHIAGIQAQLWSETTQSDNAAAYMYFPRLVAFAERAWHRAEWEVPYSPGRAYSQATHYLTEEMKGQQLQDWAQFSRTLVNKIFPQFIKDDIFFRLPTPGVKIENGVLYANNAHADLTIEFRLRNGTSEWAIYKKPVRLKASGEVEVRSRLTGLSRAGRITTIYWDANKNATSN